MNTPDRNPGMIHLVAALALGLGVAACQDKPPETIGRADTPRAADQPTSPAGAAAGTAESRSSAAADNELASRVKAALSADPELKTVSIDVNALGNAVTLVGTVDKAENRDKASQVALSVQGVNSVENRMVVVTGS